jgi:hypothetical protein
MSIAMLAGMAQGASAFVACPSGITRSARVDRWITRWPTGGANAKGVTLCEGVEGAFNDTRAYLQIADMGDGAKVRLRSDVDPESPEPWLLEPEVVFRKRTASAWYSWLRSLRPETPWVQEGRWEYIEPENTRLFSTTNATFFKDPANERETTVPFPLRSGSLASWGRSWREAHPRAGPGGPGVEPGPIERNADYEAPKKVLVMEEIMTPVWPDEEEEEVTWEELARQVVAVRSFPARYEWDFEGRLAETWETSEYTTTDFAVSFTPEYTVGSSNRRTYMGVYGDSLYIFVTRENLTNAEARATMLEIQPGMEVIQMDGGGSTSFYSAYGSLSSNIPIDPREVANVLAIYRAP